MDASQVLQSLDSLWFFTNIVTRSDDPLPSLTPPPSPSFHPECDSSTLLNLQEESKIVETVDIPCEPETETRDGGGGKRRKRRKRSERHQHGTRKSGVDSGFEKKKVLAGPLKLNPTSWKLPYDDEMAMKEHLKSWAYAVACIVK